MTEPTKKWYTAKDVVYIGIIVVILAAILSWWYFAPSTKTVDPKAPATEGAVPRKLKNVTKKKVLIPHSITEIETMDKEEVEDKIPGTLSEETKLDPNKFALKTVEIPAWKGRTLATATLKSVDNTWVGGVDVKHLPPPLFEWKKEFKLVGRYFFVGDHKIEADAIVTPLTLNTKDGGWSMDVSAGVGTAVRNDAINSLNGRAFIQVEIKH